MKRVCAAALLAAFLVTTPASAQIFGGRRQDEQIADLQRQLSELQAQLNGAGEARGLVAAQASTQAEVTAARARVDDLEASLRNLNGTVETLTGELAQARRDLASAQAQNRTLTERIARLESGQAEAATRAAAQAQAAAIAANPAAAFAEARTLMQTGRYAEAGTAFEAYAARHADQPNAPEAHYWLAETLTMRQNHGDAAQSYIAALEGWPQTPWAPDALIKLSTALVELKEPAEACKSLAEFDRRYASAPAAVKTRARTLRARAKCA